LSYLESTSSQNLRCLDIPFTIVAMSLRTIHQIFEKDFGRTSDYENKH